MYKYEEFSSKEKMVSWLNANKFVKAISITGKPREWYLFYWEEEPQPQQKDLIPESDKPQSL